MRINNQNQFVLCRGKKCCPIVTFEDNDLVTIKDDFQNTVKMTTEQFMEIENVIKHKHKLTTE